LEIDIHALTKFCASKHDGAISLPKSKHNLEISILQNLDRCELHIKFVYTKNSTTILENLQKRKDICNNDIYIFPQWGFKISSSLFFDQLLCEVIKKWIEKSTINRFIFLINETYHDWLKLHKMQCWLCIIKKWL
jgi:hypothetical protein